MRTLAVTTVALMAGLLSACADSTGPDDARRAELLGVSAPSAVARDSGFRIVAYYGRGACERALPVVDRAPARARIGMRLVRATMPTQTVCYDILYRDSVVVDVQPPYSLPYLVRFERQDRLDTAVIVRARP